jgi:hypothetical protein
MHANTSKWRNEMQSNPKKPTPPPDDPLRIFYTSLLRQNPDSKMALKWCQDRGLLTDGLGLRSLTGDLRDDFESKLRLSERRRR